MLIIWLLLNEWGRDHQLGAMNAAPTTKHSTLTIPPCVSTASYFLFLLLRSIIPSKSQLGLSSEQTFLCSSK